jgi:hypothetical protein
MTYRCRHVGVASLLFTFACGSTSHQGAGTTGGGTAGSVASSAAAGEPTGESSAGDAASAGADSGSSAGGTSAGGTSGGGAGGTSTQTEDAGADPGGNSGTGGAISHPHVPASGAAKVDLLITVDNSISMAEKQKLFAKTLPELLTRLINPFCTNSAGRLIAVVDSPNDPCPVGSQREFAPLRDLHVGVITTSLGSHGAPDAGDICTQPADDDHAHLVGIQRPNVPSYDGRGFLKWDPDLVASPPGTSDMVTFTQSLETMILSAGEHGCGFEAPLEAIYRFLIDPEPPLSITRDANLRSQRVGVDQALLQQRADFLRPDSSVAVLLLTDENDCSILDESYGWLVPHVKAMYRSTSACHVNPNDICCQSCGESLAHDGCPPIANDSECSQGSTLSQSNDALNLRCFDQKRRFGFELLYPISRYVDAFSGGNVKNAQGALVPNPLFHRAGYDRDPSLFSLAVLVGVPWQDLATTASLNGGSLEYLTPSQLLSQGRWPIVLGDLASYTPPADPFMRESVTPRSGENPITHDLIVPASSVDPDANAINGHEHLTPKADDLQYACTFELPQPITCDQTAMDAGQACDCFAEDQALNRSVCNPAGGGAATTTQFRSKAYPGLRLLGVAKALEDQAVVGSICAPNTRDEEQADFGYRPLFGALGRRIAETLVKP